MTNVAEVAKSLSAIFKTVGAATSQTEQNMIVTSRIFMRDLAQPLINRMIHSADEPVTFLDNACGSGVLVQEVHRKLSKDALSKSSFMCADSSQAMIDLVKNRVLAEQWSNVDTKTIDAQNNKLQDEHYSHVGTALGLHIIPDPDQAVKEALRVLKPGGVFGASTFAASNGGRFWIPDVRSAFATLPFDASFPDPMPMQVHTSGTWTDADWIGEHLKDLGLRNVKTETHTGSSHVEDADQFIAVFSMMLNFLRSTFWSEEAKSQCSTEQLAQHVKEHLKEKHQGKPWTIDWDIIYMTGTK